LMLGVLLLVTCAGWIAYCRNEVERYGEFRGGKPVFYESDDLSKKVVSQRLKRYAAFRWQRSGA
jgi:hypothetical protein